MTSHANIDARYEPPRSDLRDTTLRQTRDAISSSDGASRVPFTLSLQEGDPGQFHLVINADSRRVANASSSSAPLPQRGSPDPSELKKPSGMPYDPQSIGPVPDLSHLSPKVSPPISPISEGFHKSSLDPVPSKPSIRSRIFGRLRKDARSEAPGRRSTYVDVSPQASVSARERPKLSSLVGSKSNAVHAIPELDSRATVAELDATEPEVTHSLPAYSRYSRSVSPLQQVNIAAQSTYFPYDNGRTPSHNFWTPITEETSFSDAETLVHDVQSRIDPDEDDGRSTVLPLSTDVSFAGSRRNSDSSIVPTPQANFQFSKADWLPSSTSEVDELRALLGVGLASVKVRNGVTPQSRRAKSVQNKKHLSTGKQPTHRRAKSFAFLEATKSLKATQQPTVAPPLPNRTPRGGPDLRVDTRFQASEPCSVGGDGDLDSDSASAIRKGDGGRRRPSSKAKNSGSNASRILQEEAARRTISPPVTPDSERTPVRKRKPRTTSSPKISPPTIKIEPAPSVSTYSIHKIDPAKLSPDSSPIRAIPIPPDFAIAHDKRPTTTFSSLVATSLFTQALKAVTWLQRTYGPETPVENGKVRVRWTCKCGAPLYDDFIERRPGAARALEAFLNSAGSRATTTSGHGPTTPRSASSSMSSLHSNVFSQGAGSPSGGFGSHSSVGSAQNFSWSPTRIANNPFSVLVNGNNPQPSWLLTCANEGKFTTKLVHLDMSRAHIKSDKDLALTLRTHYTNLNRRWFRLLKLRGLVSINFVQLEVHRNRFADIRKSPDMPSGHAKEVYEFEPHDLIPPVGEKYLLHLFKHPEDYDGELITYLRAPKRRERLDVGVGWGINMVEGFLADRVWTLVVGLFAMGSLVFAVVWVKVRQDDVQGAFGVAAWMTTLAVLGVGWAQACLD